MALRSLTAQTDLVVVNRPARPEADRVVLTADRGKFWLSGHSRHWPAAPGPVKGRARLSFRPGNLGGELVDWHPHPVVSLGSAGLAMVDNWLSWLNRRLEVTAVSPQPDSNLETSRFWSVFEAAFGLLAAGRAAELAGAYFYLRVFDLTGQSFQLAQSSGRRSLTGDRFRFNPEQCCFEPAAAGRYRQRHIKLLRCLTAVEPRLVAQITTSDRLLAETWQLIQGHPGYLAPTS